jgi:hypothetical protein
LPPSAIRLGRTSSSTFSTFSSVRGSTRTAHPDRTRGTALVHTCSSTRCLSDRHNCHVL